MKYNTHNNDPKRVDFMLHRDTQDVTTFAIVQEYCKLFKLEEPSERDLDRITAILELAQFDPGLSCLLNEADHLIAYELGLSQTPPSQRGDQSGSFSEPVPRGKRLINN